MSFFQCTLRRCQVSKILPHSPMPMAQERVEVVVWVTEVSSVPQECMQSSRSMSHELESITGMRQDLLVPHSFSQSPKSHRNWCPTQEGCSCKLCGLLVRTRRCTSPDSGTELMTTDNR